MGLALRRLRSGLIWDLSLQSWRLSLESEQVADCGGKREQKQGLRAGGVGHFEEPAEVTWATFLGLASANSSPPLLTPSASASSTSGTHLRAPLFWRLRSLSPQGAALTDLGAPFPASTCQRPTSPWMMPGLKASTPSNVQVPTALSKLSIPSHTQYNHILATKVYLWFPTGPGKPGVGWVDKEHWIWSQRT